eukprot:12143245-Heterocapsa_arctica.AAC.1
MGAQMKYIMKLAEETWGGLCAVEAEELPKFSHQKMPLITEDEVRRVLNNLADGKAKGVDGWSLLNSEPYREHTSKASLTFLTMLKHIRDGHMVFTLSLPSSPRK